MDRYRATTKKVSDSSNLEQQQESKLSETSSVFPALVAPPPPRRRKSSEVVLPPPSPRSPSPCLQCGRKEENNMKEEFESPFLAIWPLLKGLQILGIFNLTSYDSCSDFLCRPGRIFYSLGLNGLLLALPVAIGAAWARLADLEPQEIFCKIGKTFSATDCVAMVAFLLMLQISSIGLHFNNMNLCHHLNGLVHAVRALGTIDRHAPAGGRHNPPSTAIYVAKIAKIATLLVSTFLIGWSLPTVIGLSVNPWLDLCLGISIAICATYLHLPQNLTELLFIRSVQVLHFQYELLLEHMTCCFEHEHADNNNPMGGNNYENHIQDQLLGPKLKPEFAARTGCCLRNCQNLLKMFDQINETFQGQLLILFCLITGMLCFGIYLSVTFLISSTEIPGTISSQVCFSAGFCLYSLVPAARLVHVATFVDRVVVAMEKTKHRLYELEAATETSACHPSVSCSTLNSYQGPTQGLICATVRRYVEIRGFSARNYFVVNRSLVTSILGYLSTYIVVLVQFKIADLNNRKGKPGHEAIMRDTMVPPGDGA